MTANLAATLLLIGATFFVTDGLQGIAAGALRGLNDTRVPMLFAALSFWVIGFPCVYALAFPVGLGAIGIWIGFSVAVATFAALLVWRFERLSAAHRCRRSRLGVPAELGRWTLPGAAAIQPRWWSACTIAKLGRRGDGIAETPAGPLYVPYTLPGETVDGRAVARPSRPARI